MPRQALQRLVVVRTLRPGPRRHGPIRQAGAAIRHHHVRIEERFQPQPVAGRAGAVRRVEAEQPGFDLLDREAAHGAGEARGKHGSFRAVGVFRVDDAVRQRQCRFEAVGQPWGDAVAHHHAVHHRLDLVLGLAVQRRHLADLIQRAVHLHPGEAAALQFAQFLAVFALAVPHHRREQQQARAFRHRHHPVDHLADRLRLDRQPGCGRIGHAGTRPEQTHVVVDFRHRADGGTRVLAGGLLLDGNRRRQSLDRIDIRLSHQFQELPGVGRQALDVAALPLGIDRVERQRGFARTGQSGDHGQLIAWDLHVDVLQVMLARTTHDDGAVRPRVARRRLRDNRTGHSFFQMFSGCSFYIWRGKTGMESLVSEVPTR